MAGLSFKVGADTTGLGRGLRRAEGMVGRFGKSVKGLGLGALKVGAVGAAAGVAGLAVGFKKAVQQASGLEKMRVAFTAISGSAEEADMILKNFREESERTGVSINVMSDMVKKLMANGMGSGEAQKMTRSLLDVAGTLGMGEQEAGLLGTALAQVKAKGVASMEELRQQIAEKGVPIFDVLAQKMNVTTGELIKMVSAGEVSADVVMEAFSNLEGPLEKFRGGASKMANTTAGSFQKLKTTISNVLIDAGEPFLKHVTDGLNGMSDIIRKAGPWLKGMATSAGQFVGILMAAFKEGSLPGMFKDGMIVAMKTAVNYLFAGLHAAGVAFSTLLIEGFKMAVSKIGDPEFWNGMLNMFKAAYAYMSAAAWEIRAAYSFGEKSDQAAGMAASMRARSEVLGNVAASQMKESGDGRTVGEVLKEVSGTYGTVFKETVRDPLMDTHAEMKRLNDRIERLRGGLAVAKSESSDPQKKKGVAAIPRVTAAITAGIARVSSLQGVGGASLGGASINLDEDRNRMLKNIERNTGRPQRAVYA